jgi:hypothetical protein
MQQAAALPRARRKPQAEGASPGQQQQQPQRQGQRQGQQQEGQQRSGGKGTQGSERVAPEPLELSEASPMYLPVLTDEDLENDPPGHKSGYVAVIGRPNAGVDIGRVWAHDWEGGLGIGRVWVHYIKGPGIGGVLCWE